MPLSVAYRSISLSSSAEKSSLSSTPKFCSNWATLLAPTSVEVIRGSRKVQASAICASVWRRRVAICWSARTFDSTCSVIRSAEKEPDRLAREPAGTPARYRSVSSPCASGEKTMQPIPSSPRTSRRSGSIHRFSIAYQGWWMRSGVPRSRRKAPASSVGPADDRPLRLDGPVAAEILPEPERDRGQLEAAAAGAPERHAGVTLAILHHDHCAAPPAAHGMPLLRHPRNPPCAGSPLAQESPYVCSGRDYLREMPAMALGIDGLAAARYFVKTCPSRSWTGGKWREIRATFQVVTSAVHCESTALNCGLKSRRSRARLVT